MMLLSAAAYGILGCRPTGSAPAVNTVSTPGTPISARAPVPTDTGGTAPAVSPSDKQAETHPAFDGERAFAELKKQCDFGVRPLGTDAHEKLRAYLLDTMRKYADKTITQEFKYRDMPVTNIIGIFTPAGSDKPSAHPVLLLAHWDTRPIADGPFSSETKKGVSFRYGPQGWKPTAPVGVLLLLDDGEDYGDFRADDGQGEGVELGARYFAKHFRDTPEFGQPDFGILLDMVGAKNLILPRELNSQQYAPGTNEKVYGVAQSLGYGNIFLSNETQDVEDDHISINLAGIPTIDLIHPLPFADYQTTGYRYWHTLEDTADKCSAQSLKIVGDTVAEVIYRETPAP